jgi:O-antigen/teichoic acid export membrane protein
VGIIKSVDPLITQAFISIGKANITARYTTLCAVMLPLSVFLGALQGTLTGVAVGLAISYPLSSLYLFYVARIHLDFSLRRYFSALQVPIEACLWMSVWVFAAEFFGEFAGVNSIVIMLLLKTTVGCLSYIAFMIYVRQQGLRDCSEILLELGVSTTRLNRWPFNRIPR